MKQIRWGMIGCGDVTEIKSGPGFYKAQNSTLVAVMRRNGALAADYARRHGVPRWHDDADAIIHATDIDAVYIATLTDTHCDYTLRCAAAGKPVYVEKPMAMTHSQCVAMIDACRAAGVPLWVGYYRRALPRFLKVRDLVESGAIGPVRMVLRACCSVRLRPSDGAVPWRVDPALSGGGFFFEAVCHTLDFLDFLFGPVETVRGLRREPSARLRARGPRDGEPALCVGCACERRLVLRDGRRRGAHRDRRRTRSHHLFDVASGAYPPSSGRHPRGNRRGRPSARPSADDRSDRRRN